MTGSEPLQGLGELGALRYVDISREGIMYISVPLVLFLQPAELREGNP